MLKPMQNITNFFIYSYINYIFSFALSSIIKKENYLFFYLNHKFILIFFSFLKYHTNLQFKQILDIFGIDYFKFFSKFCVVYNLNSIFLNSRIIIKIYIKFNDFLESVSSLFLSADWLEREVWDMFGIFFFKHKDLRRILTDYGFECFPLRKDFPLSGWSEIRYNFEEKRISFVPLELTQEFRFFEYNNSWSI